MLTILNFGSKVLEFAGVQINSDSPIPKLSSQLSSENFSRRGAAYGFKSRKQFCKMQEYPHCCLNSPHLPEGENY